MRRPTEIWEDVRSSLWFVPGVFTLGGIGLAWLVLRFDRYAVNAELDPFSWAYGGGADSARQILSTIAGSIITLTGVTFSMTMVALVLAAGQYSPRVLRTFTRSRISQGVLGAFAATFVYTLLILRSIRGGDDAYVPAVGVTGAIMLAIADLGLLFLFIHHIATSIQASSVIQTVADETREEIDRLFSLDAAPVGPAEIQATSAPTPEGHRILSNRTGYIESIDAEALVRAARDSATVVDLRLGPGDFAARGTPLAVAVEPADAETLDEAVLAAVSTGRQRSIPNDPAYGFRQLVDIAIKALSPGINDPATAANAIDHLGALLVRLADADWPLTEFRDADGTVRLRTPPATFADYLDLATAEVRRYGRADRVALGRLIDALARTALATARPDRREAVWTQALAIREAAARHLEAPADRAFVEAHFGRLAAELGRDPEPEGGPP
ncbi:MAG TPA: DUF2254 domain-containing protein [Gemmatimonadota bacterium]|nr:DUF2254 domain-containing protein [Gemmatimonadota bacterium]